MDLCLLPHQYDPWVYWTCFSHSSSACLSVRRALILGVFCSCTSTDFSHHAQLDSEVAYATMCAVVVVVVVHFWVGGGDVR